MDVTATPLPDVLVVRPRLFRDDRGLFLETWRADAYDRAGIRGPFVQDNAARSARNVLRGLHYQWPDPQGKLVYVLEGTVFDVAVDLRRGSPGFGRWHGEELSAENGRQLWVPPGFAHGYQVLSDSAVVAYKCTAYFRPDADRALAWDDPDIAIAWPGRDPVLSPRDTAAPRLADLPPDALPGTPAR